MPVEVDCLPLPDLVAKHDLDRIDLLHVDAEGLDDMIIGQIDFEAGWAPTFLLFEAIHLGEARFAALKATVGGRRLPPRRPLARPARLPASPPNWG